MHAELILYIFGVIFILVLQLGLKLLKPFAYDRRTADDHARQQDDPAVDGIQIRLGNPSSHKRAEHRAPQSAERPADQKEHRYYGDHHFFHIIFLLSTICSFLYNIITPPHFCQQQNRP